LYLGEAKRQKKEPLIVENQHGESTFSLEHKPWKTTQRTLNSTFGGSHMKLIQIYFSFQARLGNCLRSLYTELALKEQIVPPWAQQVAPGALCPAKLEPELRLHTQSHGLNECISVDQLLTAIQVSRPYTH
jgi:hypothetical protein